MAKSYLLLAFKRSLLGKFSGSICGPLGFTTVGFAEESFQAMIELASTKLKENPEYGLDMVKLGTAQTMRVSEEFTQLIKSDVSAAVAALSPTPERVVVRPKARPAPTLVPSIRAGHDALADSLGERVYVKLRFSRDRWRVESPLDGRWNLLRTEGGKSFCGDLVVETVSSMWATVRIEDVLATGQTRYFLPRRWNPEKASGWISHVTFASLYENYKKEKDSVSADI